MQRRAAFAGLPGAGVGSGAPVSLALALASWSILGAATAREKLDVVTQVKPSVLKVVCQSLRRV